MNVLDQFFFWCLESQLHQNQWALTTAANFPIYTDAFYILITQAATSLFSITVLALVVKAMEHFFF